MDEPRPSAQVWDPLEYSLQVLDKDSSLPLQLLRGQVRLSRLGHLPEGTPDFPFFWTSWEVVKQSKQKSIRSVGSWTDVLLNVNTMFCFMVLVNVLVAMSRG